jgi:branched-chain amino acid transport system substrate-binding protein
MRRSLAIALLALAVTALLALPACGSDDGVEEQEIIGDSLTVYSSLPLSGPLAPVSEDIVRAEKLALEEANGRAGLFNVSYVSLDSADPETGRWDPGRVAANARKAVQDRQTIAYLGEMESGASAISLPILNEGGILQVSPRDTFGGLTEGGPGSNRGEPEKYYPSGRQTFARVVPAGDRQATALVDLMRSGGVQRLVIADDRQLAGTSMGDRVTSLAREAGIDVVDRKRLNARGDVPDDLGDDVEARRADAFFYGGGYGTFAVDVLQQVHAADDAVRLYGTDDLAISPDLPERASAVSGRLELTGVDPSPAGDARDFERRFEARFGERPDRQAVLGYRAMRLVLAAIARAGEDADSRREVTRRTLELAGEPRARFVRYRVEGERLVRVGPPL